MTEQPIKIGILDSGVGGLTVVKEMRELFPNIEIIYFGDNDNCPYGNRTTEEIIELTQKMINFLEEKGVRLIAIACNTISTVIDDLKSKVPLVGIIESSTKRIVNESFEKIGIVGTEFTIESKKYEYEIHKLNPNIKIYSKASRNLAKLIDNGILDGREVYLEVHNLCDELIKKNSLKDIILGCTHYPIVQSIFEAVGRGINFINPAYEQCLEIQEILNLKKTDKTSVLEIYTSGSLDIYDKIIKHLEINGEVLIHSYSEVTK